MPACVAVIAQMPAPVIVKVEPDTVQIVLALLVEKPMPLNPLLALALRVTGAAPKLTGEAGANVIV